MTPNVRLVRLIRVLRLSRLCGGAHGSAGVDGVPGRRRRWLGSRRPGATRRDGDTRGAGPLVRRRWNARDPAKRRELLASACSPGIQFLHVGWEHEVAGIDALDALGARRHHRRAPGRLARGGRRAVELTTPVDSHHGSGRGGFVWIFGDERGDGTDVAELGDDGKTTTIVDFGDPGPPPPSSTTWCSCTVVTTVVVAPMRSASLRRRARGRCQVERATVPARRRAGGGRDVSAMAGVVQERRMWRGARRLWRHVTRQNALLGMLLGLVALIIVLTVGTESAVGQAGLVVIGVLVSYVLLPDEPSRFWRVRGTDLADVVPTSDLRSAATETVRALALQTQARVGPESAVALWEATVESVEYALADPTRVVFDMDYRIQVRADGERQLVRATVSSKRHWPNRTTVFFSFCTDVDALHEEFRAASEGSVSREVIEPEEGEELDEWERRVSTYGVNLVVDGQQVPFVGREVRALGQTSRVVRVTFDVADTSITRGFAPMRLSSEFHQAATDRQFTVKFATYFCIGSAQLTLEVDDPCADLRANPFLRATDQEVEFIEDRGITTHQITLQTPSDAVLSPGSGVVFSWEPGPLLAPVPAAVDGILSEGDPLPEAASLPTAPVATDGLDEPLVPLVGTRCVDAYHRQGLVRSPRTLVARSEVVRRLEQAQSCLPPGFSFVVLDAWRPLGLQRKLVDHYAEHATSRTDGYVADPDSALMRPPHVVGGAVDLTLAWKGRPLALGSAYDEFGERAHLHAYEGADSTTRRLRRLLASAMLGAGFAPYALEWWHWSYGDDVWATWNQCAARYDLVTGAGPDREIAP